MEEQRLGGEVGPLGELEVGRGHLRRRRISTRSWKDSLLAGLPKTDRMLTWLRWAVI